MRINYLFIPHFTTFNAALHAGHHSTVFALFFFFVGEKHPQCHFTAFGSNRCESWLLSLKGNHKLFMSHLWRYFLYLTFEFVQIPVILNMKDNFYWWCLSVIPTVLP